jgi:hypothetical protein
MSKGKIPRFRYSDVNRVISSCEACNLAKARAKKTPEKATNPATKPLERIHCDAVMIKHNTAGGKQGFSLIVDEFTKLVDVKLITRKNETQDHIKDFILRMKALGHNVKALRTDSAAEFAKDANFKKWLVEHLITQENSAPYAQHQNGVVERHIQTIEDRASAILTNSGLPIPMWGEAILFAAACWNVTAGEEESPFKLVTGREPDLNFMKPFGCRVYVRIPNEQQHHMGPRAERGIFIGYSNETKGYKIMKDGRAKSYFIRAPRDCTFKESEFPRDGDREMEGERAEIVNIPIFWSDTQGQPPSIPSQITTQRPETPPLIVTTVTPPSTPPLRIPDDSYYPSTFVRDIEQHPRGGLRSGRHFHADVVEAINAIDEEKNIERNAADEIIAERLDEQTGSRDVPKNIAEALKNEESASAARQEIEMIQKFGTWELVPITDVPSSIPVFSPIWRFTRKSDGRMKARLCFPGHRQRKGIDYTNITSPTVAMASFRLFITYCKSRNEVPIHMDIRNAYLHAEVKEDIYMKQPPGFVDPERPTHVCKLKKALYGLHQAGYNWHELIDQDLRALGLIRTEHDPCVYHKIKGDEWTIVCLYVDDLLVGGDSKNRKETIDCLKRKFNVSAEGDVKRYLGINVTTGIGPWKLDQSDDIRTFLAEQGMDKSKRIDRPGDPDLRHDESKEGPMVNQPKYRSVVGGLLWFAITTRPDILYAVNVVAQFQQHPTSRAWSAAKRIMRYLNATTDIGIIIDPLDAKIDVHTDANHGDPALGDRLSVSGGAYYMGNSLIHWTCRKQRTPAHSTAESELVAASDAAREAIWIANIGKAFGLDGGIDMYVDNKAATDIANAKGLTRRVKHIEIRDAYIRVMRERGVIRLHLIPSAENRADLFTKPFGSPAAYIHARDVTLMRKRPDCVSAGECCDINASQPLDVH